MFRFSRRIFFASIFLIAATPAQASSHQCPDVSLMRLVVDEYHLVLNDRKPICVTVPGTIKLRIRNRANADHVVAKGDVTVTQKEGSPLTISGSNTKKRRELIIKVDGDPDGVEDAQFLISVKDVGVLDPKIRVVDTDVMMLHLTHIIEDALDGLDLTWEDVARIAQMQLEYMD